MKSQRKENKTLFIQRLLKYELSLLYRSSLNKLLAKLALSLTKPVLGPGFGTWGEGGVAHDDEMEMEVKRSSGPKITLQFAI